ncbi:sigma factor-like helix-turn-helix DNA-binding protein [Lactiplantibacillus pentosus]|uniref:sigma factor-like helix-turn-helix DNA-binding protein n=1 Tax=Lactiplantibacillus pentosus TaxID=1589 RepID=UPI0021A86ED9|nr:sigma factor-like helix-turn-helix DNA-binding protein [Lactiplantibacillus pentosus]
MKNPIMCCALATLGVSQGKIDKLDPTTCHFYDLINEQHVALLWEQLVGRKSAQAVSQIEAAQVNWRQNHPDLADSLYFLAIVGASDKLIRSLQRNGVRTVSQLDDMIRQQMKMPIDWRKNPTENAALVQAYFDWKVTNQSELQRELETKPEVDLSVRLAQAANQQRTAARLQKWFGVEKIPKTLMAFLTLDFKKKDLLVSRLSGKTLQEIGDEHGLTRERVRQIIAKMVQQLPLFDDVEKYHKLVLTYDIQLDQFLNYTQGTEEIYTYLTLKYKRPKTLASLDQYLLALNKVAPDALGVRLNQHGKFINHANQVVPFSAANVIDEILFNNRRVFDNDEMVVQMKSFFEAHGQMQATAISARAVLAQIERQAHIIQRTNGYFRYYELELHDILDYLDELNALFDVADGIYGIDYFFDHNQSLMAELGLQESSELANLLKGLGYERFERLNTIVRQSQVYIGAIKNDTQCKEQFYLGVFSQFDGQSLADTVDYLEANFALQRPTMWSYLGTTYKPYIHRNMINMNVKLPSDVDFYRKMKVVLNEPIYPYDQAAAIIKLVDPSIQVSPLLMDRLGYIERSALLMQKSYASLNDAIRALWLADDEISVEKVQAYPNNWFRFKAYNLKLQHDLVAIDSTRYLTAKGLGRIGVTKPDIDRFLQEIMSFIEDDVFFTWKSLLDSGFESDFMAKSQLSDFAYERLIFTIPSIRTIKTRGSVYVNQSHPTPKCPPLNDFFAQELGGQSRDIDDFLRELNLKFGLDVTRTRALEKLAKGQLAYSTETNHIYPDKLSMYEDTYQELGIDV